ncbi:MAG: pro-sigmaK processing inhibitor BofA family protein [Candidatus Micrarchaeota archaeon]|nr:pro-sigmaK processing inhibitor BofA family protein [Candidatus Micrarchaeota archaeon]
MVAYIEWGALLVAIFILYLLYSFLKNPLHLVANAIVGIIIFLIINMFLVRDVAINFFSVATVAIAGIPGVLLVLLLHFLGLGF